MGLILITLISITLFLWVQFLWRRRKFYKVALQLPGPIGWPFIGLGLKMMNPEKYLSYMESTSIKYKSPLISWMGTKCFLYVNDPETVEMIMHSPQCINKGDFYRFMAEAIGDGLFTSSAQRWNLHRRLINPAFSRPVLNDFLPVFNTEANSLLKKLEESKCNFIDLYEVLKRSVLEAACQTTMGCKMNFQDDKSSEIFESYNSITEVCVKRMLSPWLYPDIIFQHSSLFKQQKNVVNILREFIEGLLRGEQNSFETTQPIEKRNETNNFENNLNDFINMKKSKAIFLEQVRIHINQGRLSWNDVRDEANVIIAATFETTSTALYFVSLCLAMHPEYQDKLYKELLEIFPDPTPNTNDFISITKEKLELMVYTEMVINEAMRLFSPVPMVLRSVSDAGFTLNNDIVLPIGTQIGIDIYNMQRSEQVWGRYAKEFQPESHFGPDAEKRHPFAFLPFTKGLRMCLGSRYAIMLMKVFLAKIFRYYRIHTDTKLQDLQVKGTISLKLLNYPKCWCSRRVDK